MTSLVSPLWTEMVLMVVVGARGCCSPPVGTSSTSISINTQSTSKTLSRATSHREHNLSLRHLNPHCGGLALPHVLVSTATRHHSRPCRRKPKWNCVMIQQHINRVVHSSVLSYAIEETTTLAERGEVVWVIGVSDRFLTSWSRSSLLQALGPYWARQEMYCTHHLRLKRVYINTVDDEKATRIRYYNVCLFLPRSRGHTNCIFSASYHNVPNYLINGTIFEKELLNIKFLYKFCPKHLSFWEAFSKVHYHIRGCHMHSTKSGTFCTNRSRQAASLLHCYDMRHVTFSQPCPKDSSLLGCDAVLFD